MRSHLVRKLRVGALAALISLGAMACGDDDGASVRDLSEDGGSESDSSSNSSSSSGSASATESDGNAQAGGDSDTESDGEASTTDS